MLPGDIMRFYLILVCEQFFFLLGEMASFLQVFWNGKNINKGQLNIQVPKFPVTLVMVDHKVRAHLVDVGYFCALVIFSLI